MKLLKKLQICSTAVLMATMLFSCVPEEDEIPEPEGSDPRRKLEGLYNCTETIKGQPSAGQFTVNIEAFSGNDTDIKIYNFYGLGTNYAATASVTNNDIIIPLQNINGNIAQGTGRTTGENTIELAYSVRHSGGVDSCKAVLIRQ